MKPTFKVPFLGSVGGVHKVYGVAAFALGAVVLFGCPVYSGNQGEVVCDSQGNCCDETTGNCSLWNCDYDEQCPAGASCSSGLCVSGNGYGSDGGYYYDAGYPYDSGTDATVDCSVTGCQAGFTCTLTNGVAQCLPTPDTGPATDTGAPDAGADTGPNFPPFTGCSNDSACTAEAGAGARCLDGKCVPAANTCFDSTQCPIVGNAQEECVQGVCTPSCANGASCPTGYSCDPGGTGVCTGNPSPCGAADGGTACGSGLTCVDEHCVPFCTQADGGSGNGFQTFTCSGTGLVCVDNGCIPDQSPQFICSTQGQQDTCHTGSICLNHSCYIACSLSDAGDAGSTCKTADNFNECKAVSTSTGTYDVCGSSTNLGNQCNPTQGINCSSPAICIDGYCR